MATIPQPNLVAFTAGGTIVKGHAVKLHTTTSQVVEATAVTDKMIGIAHNSAASGEKVEVAMPGGGAEAKSSGTIAAGKQLTSHTDGTLKAVAAANDRVIGVALDDAAANDLFPIFVTISQATATES
jgi:hypothetical protein